MEMYNHNNVLFKNIFPTYEVFAEWYRSTPLSSEDENGIKDVPNLVTFTLIAYEYNGCHSCMSQEGFKEHFAKDLYTYYKEFEATTRAIDELMALTDDDISTEMESITNVANIPEERSTTSVEEVDFVSTQQKNINKKGKLRIKKELLSNKRIYTVKTFINRFRHLFIKIASPAYVYVVSEPDEE